MIAGVLMGTLWLKGYTVLQIESLCSERFFNLCENRGIRIHKLYPHGEKCIFTTSIKDFYKLAPVVRKTKPHLRIKEKKGFPFLLNNVLKHQFFLAGIVIFFTVMYVLGHFVWNVSIDGNYMNSDDTMYKYLEENGIGYGTRKSTIDCEALEAQIRRDFGNIIWVSVALKGTRLDIDIRENQDEIITAPDGTPSDIIAVQDGVVRSIVARSGTPVVKAGDAIKAGDVLISGTVVTLNESSEPIATEQVYADGEVSMYIQIPYTAVLNRSYIKKEYTGHSYKSVALRFGNFRLPIQIYKEKYEYEDNFGENWILCLYQDFYLPFGADTTYHREYTLTQTQYTDDEMKQILEEDFAHYLQKIDEKGIQIIENNVTISISDEEAQMYGFIYAVDTAFGREEISIEYR